MKIFVSSTCYDLIDVRAEVEHYFREVGLVPILSDRNSSDFAIEPEENSIGTCLANVRNADSVVVILSQRYGPSLGKFGFEDISATHLEYREAVKHKKKPRFYVRDRLAADYERWRHLDNRESFDSPWCRAKDIGLLRFLDEHAQLQPTPRNNWFSVFRDSLELKSLLRRDFRHAIEAQVLQEKISTGKLPLLVFKELKINLGDPPKRPDARLNIGVVVRVQNLGPEIAHNPRLFLDTEPRPRLELQTMGPNETTELGFDWLTPPLEYAVVPFEVRFLTSDGCEIGEFGEFRVKLRSDVSGWPLYYTPKGRKLYRTGVLSAQVSSESP